MCQFRRRAKANFNPRTSYEVRREIGQRVCHHSGYFNPRTSYEVRLTTGVRLIVLRRISIHAPLTRCDCLPSLAANRLMYFNPRTSYEVRLQIFSVLRSTIRFQSTHLLRGATAFPIRSSPELILFQSTHLLRGATRSRLSLCKLIVISIHAPLTRCDTLSSVTGSAFSDFNPRTSYEVRLIFRLLRPSTTLFQSTHLLRGATNVQQIAIREFNNFNPRTSYEVRRINIRYLRATHRISIHAPLTRCD